MDIDKLGRHVDRLCIKNLRQTKIRFCADCPFEDEICSEYPELKEKFIAKRRLVYGRKVTNDEVY
jgi:hypothetical protein